MSICQIEEREAGRSYPRTCPTCTLKGPCAKGLDHEGLKSEADALRAEINQLRKALSDVIGHLDDPHGSEHVRDMRGAQVIARAALEEATK